MALVEYKQSLKLSQIRKKSSSSAASNSIRNRPDEEISSEASKFRGNRHIAMNTLSRTSTAVTSHLNEGGGGGGKSWRKASARVGFKLAGESARDGSEAGFGLIKQMHDADQKKSAEGSDSENETIDCSETGFRFRKNDSRFVNLIQTVNPVYLAGEMKELNAIVKKNEALQSVKANEMNREARRLKMSGKRLVASACEILASDDYQFGRRNF